jgi:hypothetical protein
MIGTGMKVVGIFLFFGSLMAFLAGTTFLWQGTILDRMWVLNASAHDRLAPWGAVMGIFFLLLSATLLGAGVGWLRRRRWGWWLAVGIIATQVFGDLINVFLGDIVRGLTGFIIATALLFYLLRPPVRSAFSSGPK